MSLGGSEESADPSTLVGPNRRPLQVRVGGDESSRGAGCLVELTVDSAILLIDLSQQNVDIGGDELLELSILQKETRDFVVLGQPLQNLGVGAVSGLGPFDDGKAHLLEEDGGELFRTADVELVTGDSKDFLLQLAQFVSELFRE